MMKKNKQLGKVTNHIPLEGSMNMLGLFPADPQGSYTGVPADPNEVPVQDADDL
jgi:hypothetical protein